MYYALLLFESEDAHTGYSGAARDAAVERHHRLQRDAKSAGTFIASTELRQPKSATALRMRDDKLHITDGPFAETKELLIGYYVFDCDSLDEAIAYAKQIPHVEHGAIEIRPVEFLDPHEWQLCNAEGANSYYYAVMIFETEEISESRSPDDYAQVLAGHLAMANRAKDDGKYVGGVKLMSAATATTVRVREGNTLLSDGPYAESKEVMLGVHVLVGETPTEVIGYAETIPNVRTGTVELRPIQYFEVAGETPFTWTNSA